MYQLGKNFRKIKNAQQCGHWKKIENNSKCAAMCPPEKKLIKNKNAQQCAHWKKIDKIKNAQQCAQWKKIEKN